MSISKPKMIEKFHAISKYHRPGIKRSKTTKIVLHYTGSHDVPALNTWKYFNNHKVYASAHFIVGLEGEVYYSIPIDEIAYTSNSANNYSIGIECATTGNDDHYSDKQYKTLVHLCAWLCDYYNLNPKNDIIRHYDVTKKICPKYFVNNPSKFTQFKLDCYNLKASKIIVSDIKNCTNGKDEITKVTNTTNKVLWKNGDYNCKVKAIANLNARKGRGINNPIIYTIPKGTKFEIGYVYDNWASTWDFKGQVLYICCDYIEKV